MRVMAPTPYAPSSDRATVDLPHQMTSGGTYLVEIKRIETVLVHLPAAPSCAAPADALSTNDLQFASWLNGSFATWGNSGIEPDKGKGISSPRNVGGQPHVASQRWRAAMEHYVGLDVSLKQTSICVVDQSGSVVREGVVDLDLRRSQFT